MPFQTLRLSEPLARICTQLGYIHPSPIQAQLIPAMLQGADVIATAQTGSGKTLAYVLPILQRLLSQAPSAVPVRRATRSPDSLIIVPTRELAVQVAGVVEQFSMQLKADSFTPIKSVLAHGGVSINPQLMGLRGGSDIVVATPGRLLDLLAHNALSLSTVKLCILDEADKLLDAAFAAEIEQTLQILANAQHQTVMLSATFPQALQTMAQASLRHPIRIDIPQHSETAPQIAQHTIFVDEARRTQLLRHLITLQPDRWTQVLVFVASKFAADKVAHKLCNAGFAAAAFHGDLSQGKRQDTLAKFKSQRTTVLVTTDLAARGIDIALLPVVVNYDLPRSRDDYTHRIGRTARAGAHGLAINFVTPQTQPHWRLIAKHQGLPATLEEVQGFEPAVQQTVTTDAPANAGGVGGIKGKRPSKKDKLRALATQSTAV